MQIRLTWRETQALEATRPTGATARLMEDATGKLVFWSEIEGVHGTTGALPGSAVTVGTGGDNVSVPLIGKTVLLDGKALDAMAAGTAPLMSGETLYDGGVPLQSRGLEVVGWDDRLAVAHRAGDSLTVLERDASGALQVLSTLSGTDTEGLGDVQGIAVADTVSHGQLLATVSGTEDAIGLFRVSAGGQLTSLWSADARDGIPIDTPVDVEFVQSGDALFMVVGSAVTSSVTVLRATPDGQVGFVDQIVDTLGTRFQGLGAMDWIDYQGRQIGAVAGRDGGLSVLELLPDGRLIHLTSFEATAETGLWSDVDIELVEADGALRLVVLSGSDNALIRFDLEFTPGVIATGEPGGAGDDLLYGALSGGEIQGGGGADIFFDGAGADTLIGGDGSDLFVISPDGQKDWIWNFDPTTDRLDLSAFGRSAERRYEPVGKGVLIHINGETLIVVSPSQTTLTDADFSDAMLFNADHVEARVVIPPDTMIVGTASADRLHGTERADDISALEGNDTVVWSYGADRIDGGAGRDQLDLSVAIKGATVNLTNDLRNDGASFLQIYTGIEDIIGTPFEDVLYGDDTHNRLEGGLGHDVLVGRDGDDHLLGGGDNDSIYGGLGEDVLDGGAGNDELDGGAGADRLSGGAGDDHLRGADQNDRLSGGPGYDRLWGGGGSDHLFGGRDGDRLAGEGGDDVLIAGTGADELLGGSGRDILAGTDFDAAHWGSPLTERIEPPAEPPLAHHLTGENTLSGGDDDDLLFGGDMPDSLSGDEGDDYLAGGQGADRLLGGDGNDTLRGGVHEDRLEGGAGNDDLQGDDGNDLVFGEAGADRLSGGAGSDKVRGGEGNDHLDGGTGRDMLWGDAGDDRLEGGWGADTLSGDAGDDKIEGGYGTDQLTGGAGADQFVFRDRWGVDRVTDFEDNIDTILLTKDLTDGLTAPRAVLEAYAQDVSSGVLLAFADGDSLVILGATTAQLADDLVVL
ncbi:calcium-binding protein [Palleronia caenipelagi]|uniref:Calcium-binding protein n=1 Tax=Palleronia caenipelagi TaxID=2489174 RepID=A0A547Q7R5_9RHOB|nr:calcium-binding protein [Palleronia caenipelagi]TRD22416.1 hypothetical protein FEV53_04990 [Palleronia caenipelagi]